MPSLRTILATTLGAATLLAGIVPTTALAQLGPAFLPELDGIIWRDEVKVGSFRATMQSESWAIDTFAPDGLPEAFTIEVMGGVDHDPELTYANGTFGAEQAVVDLAHDVFAVEHCTAAGCELVMYLAVENDGAAMHWFQAPGQTVDSYALEPGDVLAFTPTAAPVQPMPVVHQSAS